MMHLEQNIKVDLNKLISDYKAAMDTPIDAIPYIMKPEFSNQKSELPLTRRERRALKRKKK